MEIIQHSEEVRAKPRTKPKENLRFLEERFKNIIKRKPMKKEKTYLVVDISKGCSSDEYYRLQGTLEECQAYIKEHENEPNLVIIP
jgi:hypothetical protein